MSTVDDKIAAAIAESQANEWPFRLVDKALAGYRNLVIGTHGTTAGNTWPLLNGHKTRYCVQGDLVVAIVEDTNAPGQGYYSPVALDPVSTAQAPAPSDPARVKLTSDFRVTGRGAVLLLRADASNLDSELSYLLARHEVTVGIKKMRIFLSHKGSDKPLVRRFHEALKLLGFDPWLDEEAMVSGAELHRGILTGMKESCAAVFFITASFADKAFLADEVDYAKNRKHDDGDGFALITLVFDGNEANVPDLLRSKYVYKSVHHELDGLREILRALPLAVGPVQRVR